MLCSVLSHMVTSIISNRFWLNAVYLRNGSTVGVGKTIGKKFTLSLTKEKKKIIFPNLPNQHMAL